MEGGPVGSLLEIGFDRVGSGALLNGIHSRRSK